MTFPLCEIVESEERKLLRALVEGVCDEDSRQTLDVAFKVAERARKLLGGDK